jgi:hypothetical protein
MAPRRREQGKGSTMTGFLYPEYLVSTDWLAAHLDGPAVIILDCKSAAAEGKAGIKERAKLSVRFMVLAIAELILRLGQSCTR